MAAVVGTCVPAGPHAHIEAVASNNGSPALVLTVAVPFALDSMANVQLDINAHVLRLQGPEPGDSVEVPMPSGFALDPDGAAAKFSKKKRQLTVSSPNVCTDGGVAEPNLAAPVPGCAAAAAPEVASPARQGSGGYAGAAARSSPTPMAPAAAAPGGADDDDDDDLPPVLVGAHSVMPRSKPSSEANRLPPPKSPGSEALEGVPEVSETNEVAEALMQKALAAREQKRKEAEASRQAADLSGGSGLKKGFLASGKSKKPGNTSGQKAPKAAEEITYVAGSGDAECAKRKSLQIPEVQQALRQNITKMKEDTSWVTPQLMQALQTRPELLKAMSDPKMQQAMSLMQNDPEEARRRYEKDEKVSKFLMEFSSLMATHFDVLAATSGSSTPSAPAFGNTPCDVPAASAPATTATPKKPIDAPVVIEDPKVQDALQDPQVQALIESLRRGQPLEMHELCRRNPWLFDKVRVLLDAGLLSMQT